MLNATQQYFNYIILIGGDNWEKEHQTSALSRQQALSHKVVSSTPCYVQESDYQLQWW